MSKKIILSLIAFSVFVFLYFNFSQKEVKIIFVGDMFFDRHIRRAMYREGEDFVLSCIQDFLKSSDFVVGNLEGPITENASVSIISQIGAPENFTFTFPTNTAKLLAKNNIKIVSLGNNHIGNFGKAGINSTKKYLDEVKVEYFGGLKGDDNILRKDFNSNKLSFISYNQFGGDNVEKVLQKIKKEKEDDRKVIVFAHWGEEYIEVNNEQKRVARIFADSGASLIIGAHPHVIQKNEILEIKEGDKTKKVPVYYSLGNFLFDQYWNEEVRTGLALEIDINGENIKIKEHKTYLQKDGRVCLKS